MFNFVKASAEWKRGLYKYAAFEDGCIAELESHLREEFERLKGLGINDEEAFAAAAASIGRPESIALDYSKTDAAGPGRAASRQARGLLLPLLRSHFIFAWRKLLRHKGYSLINISGLSAGMACCILLFSYVQDELAFDRHHENRARIYRLIAGRTAPGGTALDVVTPPPLGPALVAEFPQVSRTARFLRSDNPMPLIIKGDRRFYENGFCFVDAGVFDIFTIPFVRGNRETALQKPNTVVITDRIARKYFGDDNPLGQTLGFNAALDLEVTGVIETAPSNSTLQYDFLASFSTLAGWLGKDFVDDWRNNTCQTYALLSDKASAEALARELPGFVRKHLGEADSFKTLRLQPLGRIHLFSFSDYGLSSTGDIREIYLLSGAAILILLIACLNYVNLTSARAVLRSREVGLRKAVGASRGQLIQQFFGEAFLMTGVTVAAAAVLVPLGRPFLSALMGRNLAASSAQDFRIWLGPIALILLAMFISSGVLAFLLSSFEPAAGLKGQRTGVAIKAPVRRFLVVIQFALAITLLIGTRIVSSQLDFVRRSPAGFEKDGILVIPIRNETLRQNPEPLKTRVRQQPGVQSVATASLLPGGPVGKTRYRMEAGSEEGTISMLWIDPDFISTLGLEVIAGRDFSKRFRNDASESVILNETAIRGLGWRTPADAVGRTLVVAGRDKGTVIGVVKDFHVTSMHREIESVAMILWPWSNYALVRVDETRRPDTLARLKDVWRELDPDHPMTYSFLGDNFERHYQSDRRLGKATGYFSWLAVFVACLGLFGLAAFAAEQRTREIGIRKVLGARTSSIVGRQLKETLVVVCWANLAAWPIGYLVMADWLRSFAYRAPIRLGPFIGAGWLALSTAILTVGIQAIKAAAADPVMSLRHE